MQQDSMHTHTLQGSTDKPSRLANEGDAGVSRLPVVQAKNRLQAERMYGSMDEQDQDDSTLAELRIRKRRSLERKDGAQIEIKDVRVGPGQYDPKIEAGRKQAPAYSWCASKTVRDETTAPQLNK